MNSFNTLVERVLEELKISLHDVQDTERLRQEVHNAKRIFIAGKGRSGLQMRAFAMRLMHLGFAVHVVDDVTTPAITENDLLVIGSGSGRTPSLVQYARQAKTLHARLALITINETSPIAEQADCRVIIRARTPKLEQPQHTESVLAMGSLFEQALGLLLDITISQIMTDLNMSDAEMFTRHANLE